MGTNEYSCPDLISNVRNMSISRRGGIRTRGGRLPPIRIRETMQLTAPKKVIAPKIPQRRNVKKELETSTPLIRKNVSSPVQFERGRGRGRGKKVFIQLEGTLLAEGPAAKTKRDTIDPEAYSIPRSSRSTTREATVVAIDPEIINDLLESYEGNNAYEDDFGAIPPYRLPLLKYDVMKKVKTEPQEKINIKAESLEKISIKTEPLEEIDIKTEPLDEHDIEVNNKNEDDTWNKLEGKVFTKIESKVPNAVEEFFNIKDEGKFILLQLPNCLPFAENDSKGELKEETKEINNSKPASTFIDTLPEGKIGKLQILKSGRRRLILGSMVFELVDGAVSETYKEIVSVRVNENDGNITVMGLVDKTMIVRPLINEIIKED